jgi:hypothetical protein
MNWNDNTPRRGSKQTWAPGGANRGKGNDSGKQYRPGLDVFHLLNEHPQAQQVRECIMRHAFGEPLEDGDSLLFDRPGGGTLTLVPSGAVLDDQAGVWTGIPVLIATLTLGLPDARGFHFGKVAGFVEVALRAANWPGLKDPSNFRRNGGGR